MPSKPIKRMSFNAAFRSIVLWAQSLNATPESAPSLTAGSGAPSDSEPDGSVYHRTDGAANTTLYARVSSSWTAVPTDIGSASISDTNTYYGTDTVDGALDALGAQIGGATDATYNFTEANVLADDDSVYPALEKLDLKWGDLAAVANGEGASLVGLEDAGAYTNATDVESAIAEIYTFVRSQIVSVTLSAGAEVANVIDVTVNVVDLAGTAVSRTQRLVCSLYEATMIEAVAAAATMAETGAGSEVSTTAQSRLVIDTDANGDATLSITDVAGASSKTFYLIVQPVPPSGTNTYGAPAMIAITFDGA